MNLPEGLARTAQRSLDKAGITHLEHLTEMSEWDVGRLNGIGPGTLTKLREVLAANGMSFAAFKKPAKDGQ